MTKVLPLITSIGVIALIDVPPIGQIIFAQPQLLLLDFPTVLAILGLLRELRPLQLTLVLLRQKVGD
ncbi:hypothetical protein RU03_26795 [Pseudomonas simiae]|nr:hypothetical protein RU03_26795 [Pseudomonas simiae]